MALQFPDELMQDAVTVTDKLQKAVNSETTVFILGDTSYGRCDFCFSMLQGSRSVTFCGEVPV